MQTETALPHLLATYFTARLRHQRQASPHTIARYRDPFCLLLRCAPQRLHKPPSALRLEDLDAPCLGAFLAHLAPDRGKSASSRNARLAALHSFFHSVALHAPQCGAVIQRVLAIPSKRAEQTHIAFLTRPESEALLAAPEQATGMGRRDRTLFLLAIQTGLRVSELTGWRCQDVVLGAGAHVRCHGKGRKERCTPLRQETLAAVRRWLRER